MSTIIQWWNLVKARWMNYKISEEEDFEILDFDHIPYINEVWKDDLK